jgi:hypothetical protein
MGQDWDRGTAPRQDPFPNRHLPVLVSPPPKWYLLAMPTTLEMLETSYPEPDSLASTTTNRVNFGGCWAASTCGCDWHWGVSAAPPNVVVDDRLAANPINRLDPQGTKIIAWDASFDNAPRDKQAVTRADANTSRQLNAAISAVREFDDAAFFTAFTNRVRPSPGTTGYIQCVYFTELRKNILGTLEAMQYMLDVTGIKAHLRCNADRVKESIIWWWLGPMPNLLAYTDPGKNDMYFEDRFFQSDARLQDTTYMHELSHAAASTHDSKNLYIGVPSSEDKHMAYLQMVNSAYFIEDFSDLSGRGVLQKLGNNLFGRR